LELFQLAFETSLDFRLIPLFLFKDKLQILQRTRPIPDQSGSILYGLQNLGLHPGDIFDSLSANLVDIPVKFQSLLQFADQLGVNGAGIASQLAVQQFVVVPHCPQQFIDGFPGEFVPLEFD
jgi:hypothetical protein